MPRKHSYRVLAKREHNLLVLRWLREPEKMKQDYLESGYAGPRRDSLQKIVSAKEEADRLKMGYLKYGDRILKKYSPFIKEIKTELEKQTILNGLQSLK